MLLASYSAVAFGQTSANESHLQDFTKALFEGRGSVTELLKQLKVELPEDDWEDTRDRLVGDLERDGKLVVTRYVEGDEVPQQKKDYERCARALEAANQLDPDQETEARMWFCRGQAILGSASRPDYEAAGGSPKAFAGSGGDIPHLY